MWLFKNVLALKKINNLLAFIYFPVSMDKAEHISTKMYFIEDLFFQKVSACTKNGEVLTEWLLSGHQFKMYNISDQHMTKKKWKAMKKW